MARTSISAEMREMLAAVSGRPTSVGPFVTISRQHGCHGYTLGQSLAEALTEESGQAWRAYHKEILSRLATETNLAKEFLEREMSAHPNVVVDFFRAFATEHIPSGYEIRSRITTILRGLAMQGHAVIVGQGGAGATQDLHNGLAIRLEAPQEWRARQVAAAKSLSVEEARREIQQEDAQRDYLRRLYLMRFPRKPEFHITYDCSEFTLRELTAHIVAIMKLKDMLGK